MVHSLEMARLARCRCLVAWCMLRVVRCMPYIAGCMVHGAWCVPHVACCMRATWCMLHAGCMLVACCTWPSACCLSPRALLHVVFYRSHAPSYVSRVRRVLRAARRARLRAVSAAPSIRPARAVTIQLPALGADFAHSSVLDSMRRTGQKIFVCACLLRTHTSSHRAPHSVQCRPLLPRPRWPCASFARRSRVVRDLPEVCA